MQTLRLILLTLLLSFKTRLDAWVEGALAKAGFAPVEQHPSDELDEAAEMIEPAPGDEDEILFPDAMLDLAEFQVMDYEGPSGESMILSARQLIEDGGLELLQMSGGDEVVRIANSFVLSLAAATYASGEYAFSSPKHGYLTPTYAWYAATPFV